MRNWLAIPALPRIGHIIAAGDAYVLHESEIPYQAYFEPEKGCLSMDNGVYFDEKEKESIC